MRNSHVVVAPPAVAFSGAELQALCNGPVTGAQCCCKKSVNGNPLYEFKSSVRLLNGGGAATSANATEFVVGETKIERQGLILRIYEAEAAVFVMAHGLRRIVRANFTNRHAAGT